MCMLELQGNLSGGGLESETGGGSLTSLSLTQDGGIAEAIYLPSCFNLKATFSFDQPVTSPTA